MKLLYALKFIGVIMITYLFSIPVYGQHVFTSSCGYSIQVNVVPIGIIPENLNCPTFYNYNVRFTYQMNVLNGPIPNGHCGGGSTGGSLWTAQVEVLCYGSANGSYQLPLNGGAGTITTSSSNTIYNNGTTNNYSAPFVHCSQANTIDFQCNEARIRLEGPGLSVNTTIDLNPIIPLGIENVNLNVKQIDENTAQLTWLTPLLTKYDYYRITHIDQDGKIKDEYQIDYNGQDTLNKLNISPLNANKNYFKLYGINMNNEHLLAQVHLTTNTINLLTIYPNPNTANRLKINVSKNLKLNTLVITNTLGQRILEFNLEDVNDYTELDLQLKPGVYLLNFYTNNKIITKTYSVL